MRRLENTYFNELKELRVRKHEKTSCVWCDLNYAVDIGVLHFFKLTFDIFKDSTSALEEKYKKAMVQNAQLDNEKTTIHYEVFLNI